MIFIFMKLIDLLEELKEKICYDKFIFDNPESFFCAGFFILDLESSSEKIHLDFFLPKEEKIASFEFPFNETKIHEDKIGEMKEQSTKIKIDIDDLENISKKIIKKNNSSISPTKIIAVIKEDEWNITCMDNHLGIVRIRINAISGKEISFDKGSLMDF